MILLDTSILVDSLCGSKHSERQLNRRDFDDIPDLRLA
jgi:predicted nucleic acid-binding protein